MLNSDTSSPRALRIGDKAPVFRARTTQGDISLDQYLGKWLIFFSHPADFTPVCTTEFIAIARAAEAFEALDYALLGLSVDSLFAHIGWLRAIYEGFGVSVTFPIVEDPSMAIARAYGMLDDAALDSAAIRATYFIDPAGIVRAMNWYPMTIGRSVDEMLRLAAALKRTASGTCLTPEGWRPGDDLLLPAGQTQDFSSPTWFCQRRADL
ncbi:MAG: peroxiredoxin [Acidocella sp.]|nr:peroxiredoxin [Acidocella sp.]